MRSRGEREENRGWGGEGEEGEGRDEYGEGGSMERWR